MTLHGAIKKILKQSGKSMTAQQIADELNKNGWYKKKDGSIIQAFQIHGRTKNYANIFDRDGSVVSLINTTIVKTNPNSIMLNKPITKNTSNRNKDEHYVLDLCDKILGLTSSLQHRFDFLLGDTNKNGVAVKLPVDSYYENLKLVIEYRERQHTESVNFFDKIDKITVSGVHRGEQRKIYDERRRQILPKYGIKLIEIAYSDFTCDGQKRIIRNIDYDENIIRQKLKDFL